MSMYLSVNSIILLYQYRSMYVGLLSKNRHKLLRTGLISLLNMRYKCSCCWNL